MLLGITDPDGGNTENVTSPQIHLGAETRRCISGILRTKRCADGVTNKDNKQDLKTTSIVGF